MPVCGVCECVCGGGDGGGGGYMKAIHASYCTLCL
jgi:hypothetical protein